jgi:hypothetical protein
VAESAVLIDSMTRSSLDNTHGMSPSRAAGASLAFVALLSNVLFAAALSIAADLVDGSRDTFGLKLCSASPVRKLPGKDKPGLPLRDCALCAMPAPLPSRPQASFALPDEVTDGPHPQLRTTWSAAPLRHGLVQARAPPPVA